VPYNTASLKPVQAPPTANVFEVRRIEIMNDAPPRIRLWWRYGTKDAAVIGGVNWEGELSKSFDATALGTAKPDGTKTWYQNLKNLSYSLLLDAVDLPAGGTVS